MRILPRWSGLQGALLSLLFASAASAVEPLRLYGDEVYYSVERKGKPIGDYRLSFEENETGDVSRLDVQLEAEEQLQVGARQVTALRYRLGGDLDDTLSWYDLQGRWLGMEFSARDGSRILVRLQPYTELAQRETP